MAQNFPNSPALNTIYTVNNESWTYDGSGWARAIAATGSGILPSVSGNTGRYLTTDGSTISWGTVAAAVPKITSISVTDSSYTVLDDTAVGTSGGYIKIVGTGFTSGSQVLVGTVAATSVSFVSSTELRAQVPATAAGTYVVYVVATDGSVAIRVNGITFSATPTWSTGSSLGTSGAVISIQLAATSDTAITYSLAVGSTLPTGLTLSSSGLLSGTVTGVTVDTTYNFTVNAVDAENQDSPRSFSITITVKDSNFSYVPLLVETGSVSVAATTVADGAQTPNTVTRNGGVPTGWTSPYQTDGYWSNYLNGSSTYLNIGTQSILNVGTGNFTVECFIFFPGRSTTWSREQILAPTEATQSSGLSIGITGATQGSTGITATVAGTSISSTTAISANTWHHVAVVRSSGTVTIYVDGVSKASGTAAGSISNTASYNIGSVQSIDPQYSDYFQGYISNFRTTSTAVYSGSTITVPTSPLSPSTANQTLLTCYSNRFIDANTATTAKTITVTGTPSVQSGYYPFAAPTASPGAALLNGTNQYLTASGSPVIGTNDFTIEGWVYTSTYASFIAFIDFRAASTNGVYPYIYINTDGTVRFYVSTADRITGATAISLNAWNHIAVSRTSSVTKLFLNGVQQGSNYSDTNSYLCGASRPAISSSGYTLGSGLLNGYISNLRVVNGTGVYTGAFTPPSGPLTQTGGTYPSTTNVNASIPAANTSLLLNLADSNYTSASSGGTNNTFIDSSTNAFTITRNGTPTQGSRTPYWPNGQWSNYFPGGASDTLNLATNAIPASGAFTFETFVYVTGTAASQCIAAQYPNGTASGRLMILWNDTANKFTVVLGASTVFVSDATYSANSWLYLVFQRDASNVWSMYVNGTRNTATVSSATAIDTAVTYIGNRNTGGTPYTGYISNLRVVSSALYSGSTISVPTTPFSVSTTNQVLLTCYSNRFIDANTATAAKTITVNGTPTVQAFQPFSPAASYSAATYAGSGYFNGSTDYLSLASNTAFNIFGGDMTIDGWLYPTALAGRSEHFLAFIVDATNRVSLYFSGTTFTFWTSTSGGGSGPRITSASFPTNTWTHVALVKSGATFTLYINGISAGTSATTVYPTSAMSLNVGTYNGVTSADAFTGYMSNVRVVKGTAVYTAAFTPPTTPVTNTAQTSLLLNMANAGIYDAAAQNDITTVGDAQVVTTPPSKWPPSSMAFDGTGDWLILPTNPIFQISGNYTIEAWMYATTVNTYQNILSQYVNATNGFAFGYYSVSGWYFNYRNNAAEVTNYRAGTSPLNAWVYVAFVKSGTTGTLYVNGSAIGATFTAPDLPLFSTSLYVGAFANGPTDPWTGYIQDLRVTKGVARTITTPTLAFQTR